MRACRNIEYTSVDTRDCRAKESQFFELHEKPYLWKTILHNSEVASLIRAARGLMTRTVIEHLVGNLIGSLQSPDIHRLLDFDCASGDLTYHLSSILDQRKFLGFDQSREVTAIANSRYSHRSNLHFTSQLPEVSQLEPIDLILWRFPSLIVNWPSRFKLFLPFLKNGTKLKIVEWLSIEPFVLPQPAGGQPIEKFVNSMRVTDDFRDPEKFQQWADDSLSINEISLCEKTESISILGAEQKRAMCTLTLLTNELQRRNQPTGKFPNELLLFNDLGRMILNNYSFGQIQITFVEISLK